MTSTSRREHVNIEDRSGYLYHLSYLSISRTIEYVSTSGGLATRGPSILPRYIYI